MRLYYALAVVETFVSRTLVELGQDDLPYRSNLISPEPRPPGVQTTVRVLMRHSAKRGQFVLFGKRRLPRFSNRKQEQTSTFWRPSVPNAGRGLNPREDGG
jgi:hypothetical protein